MPRTIDAPHKVVTPYLSMKPASSIAGGAPGSRIRSLVHDAGALVTYGDGLGTIAVTEHAAGAKGSKSALSMLPAVSINGATGHELATELGLQIEPAWDWDLDP